VSVYRYLRIDLHFTVELSTGATICRSTNVNTDWLANNKSSPTNAITNGGGNIVCSRLLATSKDGCEVPVLLLENVHQIHHRAGKCTLWWRLQPYYSIYSHMLTVVSQGQDPRLHFSSSVTEHMEYRIQCLDNPSCGTCCSVGGEWRLHKSGILLTIQYAFLATTPLNVFFMHTTQRRRRLWTSVA
jgi:hypothetical protein